MAFHGVISESFTVFLPCSPRALWDTRANQVGCPGGCQIGLQFVTIASPDSHRRRRHGQRVSFSSVFRRC